MSMPTNIASFVNNFCTIFRSSGIHKFDSYHEYFKMQTTKLEDKQTFCNDREKLLYFKHERNRGDEIQVVSNLRLYLMNTNLLVCNLWLYQIMVVAHDVCGKSGSLPQQSTRKSPPKIKQKKHMNY